ncbi:MAG TPA: GNAT family protein [Thermoleophilaceae bacterium]|nr:GNAT family protein [Thermoleophilaceae bacterium]
MSGDGALGPRVDWTPSRPPARESLTGAHVRLEPFADAHRDALHRALHGDGADGLWDYLPYGPFDERAWRDWFAASAASADPLFYAVVGRADERPVGQGSYLRIDPEHGSIEIGHLAFGPALQRTPGATEAVFLLARHAFDELGYRRVEWKCNALNERSRAAALRLGFEFEGVFRQHMVVKGRNRDTAWYAIVDGDWPRVRAAHEEWLRPGNFDGAGRQRRTLASLRA